MTGDSTSRDDIAFEATTHVASPPLSVFDAIRSRRTHKNFTATPVERKQIEALLDAAILAPNHRMTEPWRFIVLGPQARQMLGGIRAAVKCGPPSGDDDARTAAKRADIVARSLTIPCIIAVAIAVREDDDDVRREEDLAATFMAVQNMLLAAAGVGLGTKVATGPVLRDAALRTLLQLSGNERCVALIHIGEPAEQRARKERTPAESLTRWLD